MGPTLHWPGPGSAAEADAPPAAPVAGDVASEAEFRRAMGSFPTGVTVVTSVGSDGAPVGTTASAVSSLSLDPPLLLVCFDRQSQTLHALRSHGGFVVNVLAEPQQHLSANFARRGSDAAWDQIAHQPGVAGSPRLHGTLATLDCTVERCLPGGDHEIIIGRVRAALTADHDAPPLVYWRGAYVAIDGGPAADRTDSRDADVQAHQRPRRPAPSPAKAATA